MRAGGLLAGGALRNLVRLTAVTLLVGTVPALAEAPGVAPASWQAGKPLTVRLGDELVFKPSYLTDLDQAGFAESRPGGQAAELNLRQQQMGGHVSVGDAVTFGAAWDFGSSPGGRGRLLEAQVSITTLNPLTMSVGIFKPQLWNGQRS